MQNIYISVAFKQADYKVNKYLEKGVKKSCKIAEKGVKSLILRNFQQKTYGIHICSCSNWVGGLYDEKKF